MGIAVITYAHSSDLSAVAAVAYLVRALPADTTGINLFIASIVYSINIAAVSALSYLSVIIPADTTGSAYFTLSLLVVPVL